MYDFVLEDFHLKSEFAVLSPSDEKNRQFRMAFLSVAVVARPPDLRQLYRDTVIYIRFSARWEG